MEYWLNALDFACIIAIYALALNLVLGYAGQLTIAPAGLGGVGGYTAAYLSLSHGWAFVPALVLGVVTAIVVGFLLGLPALRLSQDYLILLTLAFAAVVIAIFEAIPALGGVYGLIGVPPVSIGDTMLITAAEYLRIALPIMLVCLLVCWRIGSSPFGRVLRGIREDEPATEALGKNVLGFKVLTFSITAGIMGLAGVLYVYFQQSATPTAFGFAQTTAIVAAVVIGGSGNILGSLAGAVLVSFASPVLQKTVDLAPETAGTVQLVIYGALLIAIMRLMPGGIIPEGASLRLLRRRGPGGAGAPTTNGSGEYRRPRAMARAPLPSNGGGEAKPVVQVRDVAKHFNGIQAVRGLSFDLPAGRVTALLGPNGAGKTTVFNLMTGRIRPDTGEVLLDGKDIVGLPPHRVARLGMVRSFQDVRNLGRLTLLQNVSLAVPDQPGEQLRNVFFRPLSSRRGERAARERALEVLDYVGLADRQDMLAGELGYGDQKLLSLARILATGGEVLLIDEPASGVDAGSMESLLAAIESLRSLGKTICLVEHNLDVVEHLADHVLFMEQGQITARGPMTEIKGDPRLAEVYFGHV
ncbi:MAG: hypothetical protein BGO11_15095 [Solirubrobacterales bacterium 70-9]|nr:MAG: hypothetical protein BGO11_15095 [Solirubrobacterales bacterium 70-9]